jgi:hypothetical protein
MRKSIRTGAHTEIKMMITGRKRVAIIVTSAVLVAGGAGAAFAYWAAQGTGAGTAATGKETAFTISTVADTTSGALTPGGPTQTISFTITNPSTGAQKVSSVAASVASSDGKAWTAVTGCSAADYTVGTPSITYGQIAPGGTLSGTVTIQMNNLTSNQDACKSASVPLYLAAS